MKPYVFEFIPEEDLKLFEKIKIMVAKMSDIDLGKDKDGKIILSCHILVRAVAKFFSLKFVDGYLYPNFNHSWLVTPNGNIVDVYPIATIGGPVLIDGSYNSPARWLYKKDSVFCERYVSGRSFRRSVKKVYKALKSL